MAKKTINLGTAELAGNGETLRSALGKVNDNFTELYNFDATAFDGAFASLTGKPTTIAGYGITDAFDRTFASLTGKPTTIAGYGITDAFDGAYGSLTGSPTIPSALTDLSIVDGTNGQVLTTDGSGNFTFTTVSGGGGPADTDALSEGTTNLYYTDARVNTYLSSNDYDTATNIVASITDSAPGTLDTLNELAAALGDDANYATTTANNIAGKLSLTGGTMACLLYTSPSPRD